jgi:hypothetical protein
MRCLKILTAPRASSSSILSGVVIATSLGVAGCLKDLDGFQVSWGPDGRPYAVKLPPPYKPTNFTEFRQSADNLDAEMVKQLEDARPKSRETPGSGQEARRWAGALRNAYRAGTVERGKISGPSEMKAIYNFARAAAEKYPNEKPEILAAWGHLLLVAGNKEEGLKNLDESMKLRPNLSALGPRIEVLDQEGKHAEVGPLCKTTRPHISDSKRLYYLLDKCMKHSGADSIDAGLAWADPTDITYFKAERAKVTLGR